MESLLDYFTKTSVSIAVITETWFYKCEALKHLMCRAENDLGLGLINSCRTRRKTSADPGGGVSIVYKRARIQMKEVHVDCKGQEICLAEGKLEGQSRKLYLVGCYLSTRLKKNEERKYMNVLSDILGELETKNPNAEIIVAGDFNRADLSPTLYLHQEIKLLSTPPTRNDTYLDLVATTLHLNLQDIQYLPPLEPDADKPGTRSDLEFFMCSFSVATCHEFRDLNKGLDEYTEAFRRGGAL